jgi:hypothetical protein
MLSPATQAKLGDIVDAMALEAIAELAGATWKRSC